MAITYQIDPAAKLVHTKVEGRVSLEDMLSHAHLLKSDPAFRPEYSNLIDLSHFTGTDLNQDAMKAFARGFQGEIFAPSSKRAVVAPGAPAFELSRKFQSMRADQENFQVFHTMDEALHWLHAAAAPNKAILFE
jgi:hypothetical protein